MKPKNKNHHTKLLKCLCDLPKRIVSLQDKDHAPEFILHGLCNEDCFNVLRAAFFIDNPDFNVFRGVAGFCKAEPHAESHHMWEDPIAFTNYMGRSAFNKLVRDFARESIKPGAEKELQAFLLKNLGFEKPQMHLWPLKHENKGVLVFEHEEDLDWEEEHFINSLHLLSLCPVS
ncbi:hypothetical protein HN446_05135 [bacterium]|jgi:hypothetical protein|nr:hypothetical protein [bacterium]